MRSPAVNGFSGVWLQLVDLAGDLADDLQVPVVERLEAADVKGSADLLFPCFPVAGHVCSRLKVSAV
jgi:hypothetical protein